MSPFHRNQVSAEMEGRLLKSGGLQRRGTKKKQLKETGLMNRTLIWYLNFWERTELMERLGILESVKSWAAG